MSEGVAGPMYPSEVFGRRVIEVCSECEGEGRIWGLNEEANTHWAERCERCNCIGFILDVPLDQQEMDPDDVPF